jgi:hypothetical protein
MNFGTVPTKYIVFHLINRSTGATIGAGTAYPYRVHVFTSSFKCGSCCSVFSFLCSVGNDDQWNFNLTTRTRGSDSSLLTAALYQGNYDRSVLLRYTDSDYPFGIFKLFLRQRKSLFLFSNRELYIYMWKHYSRTCIYLQRSTKHTHKTKD